MAVGGQHHAPAALPPRKINGTRYIRRLSVPQDRLERARKISPPQGLDPWNVQPVARRYTNYIFR
jgi:hypothetical protein